MRYSKRDREMAARICAVVASSDAEVTSFEAEESLGASMKAACLAGEAFLAASLPPGWDGWMTTGWYGEAEALIRTGWCP